LVIVILSFLISACGSQGSSDLQEENTPSPSELAKATATHTPLPPTPTIPPSATATPTAEPSPTATQASLISVLENTNCRTGPGVEYLFKGVLEVGEVAEVIARNEGSDFFYIVNPDIPDEYCWLWGEFAQVEGVSDAVPIITPAPSPTPLAGFEVYVKSFVKCPYAKQIVFAVRNAGSQRIWSGYVEVQDLGTRGALYSARERHPFADTVEPACPPGHGNELWPGETRYIHVPIPLEKSGIEGVGIFTLCTADHQGGTCMTEYSYFALPEDED
jgi:hypothetical protein